jgi:hypothetical protein
MKFNASMLNQIQSLVQEELKKGIVYDDPDINEEFEEIIKICKSELKDFYGYAGAMGVLLGVNR